MKIYSKIADELIHIAIETTKELKSGEEFIVKDFFIGYKWNRIPAHIRASIGSSYFAYALGDGSTEIRPLGKTSDKQQMYEKI